ncbi:MAG: xylulokinase [Bacteroidales bacterium]
MSKYIIAHDLGTSGNKATLFDESGTLIASKVASYKTDFRPGNIAEQNPHDWWEAVVKTTKELLQVVPAEKVAGIALSGQMMGCLLVDKNGNPLRPHMLYCDQRSFREEAFLSDKMDPDTFYRITGHRISASYSIEKLMWVKNNEPRLFADAYKMLNAKDYINYRLCGVMATDPSDASGTNAYDINTWQWSEQIIENAGLDLSLFPQVRSSIDVIGEITTAAAQETGLKKGTPVICGGGDGSCAGVGVGCVSPGTSYNYLGSSSWVALTVEKPIIDEQRRTMNWAHVVPGLLHPSGTMQTAGSSYNWMISQLCQNQKAEADRTGQSVYDLIDDSIRQSPIGSNKLLFLPYLMGERTPRWNVDAKGAFVGLTIEHQHADMLRAVMEGITLNLGYIVNIFRAHVPMNRMTVIGGGAKNLIWQQMMADIYQTEIRIPNYLEEATSMGAAVLAGIGSGLFPDFSVTDRFVKIQHTVTPVAENVEAYKRLMPVFDKTYHALCGVYDDLAKL